MLCTIIGAGPGLGAAIAKRFAAAGYAVALVARNRDKLADWRAHQPAPDDIRLFRADAAAPTQLDEALGAIRAWRGDTDVLVYNAADMRPDDAAQLTAERFIEAMRTDVGGALTAVQDVLPAMRGAHRGTILFTGGGLALEPSHAAATLSAGKAALRSLANGLYRELLPDGIHVASVTICGAIRSGTEFDPDAIAERYWRLHAQPPAAAEPEIVIAAE